MFREELSRPAGEDRERVCTPRSNTWIFNQEEGTERVRLHERY